VNTGRPCGRGPCCHLRGRVLRLLLADDPDAIRLARAVDDITACAAGSLTGLRGEWHGPWLQRQPEQQTHGGVPGDARRQRGQHRRPGAPGHFPHHCHTRISAHAARWTRRHAAHTGHCFRTYTGNPDSNTKPTRTRRRDRSRRGRHARAHRYGQRDTVLRRQHRLPADGRLGRDAGRLALRRAPTQALADS
jgi:hypothetical protein